MNCVLNILFARLTSLCVVVMVSDTLVDTRWLSKNYHSKIYVGLWLGPHHWPISVGQQCQSSFWHYFIMLLANSDRPCGVDDGRCAWMMGDVVWVLTHDQPCRLTSSIIILTLCLLADSVSSYFGDRHLSADKPCHMFDWCQLSVLLVGQQWQAMWHGLSITVTFDVGSWNWWNCNNNNNHHHNGICISP